MNANRTPSQAAPDFLSFVAANVRRLRLAAGLSQKELADQSGVSLRMIGAIEAGSSTVSTATLDRIGIVFDATLSDLVSDPSTPVGHVVERLGWVGDHGGSGTLQWSLRATREVDSWVWTLKPGERYQASADPEGWHVMLFVVEGRLTIEYDDSRVDIERDGYLLENLRTHAFVNATETDVRFFRCTSW
ncbi:MAG: helix-turn-helix transcriptional regulator [Gemmatimonadaceae bacterium]|nr:helix-turn-helix transcriptional regulator [Gemmatimonadaceae bacterium]